MANLNKSVVIQLTDAGIHDLITDFDVEHEYWSTGCSTCGSFDDDYLIHYVKVMSTVGERVIEIGKDNVTYQDEADVEKMKAETAVTQSDLTRLILNTENLEKFKSMTLEEFTEWLETSLSVLVSEKMEQLW